MQYVDFQTSLPYGEEKSIMKKFLESFDSPEFRNSLKVLQIFKEYACVLEQGRDAFSNVEERVCFKTMGMTMHAFSEESSDFIGWQKAIAIIVRDAAQRLVEKGTFPNVEACYTAFWKPFFREWDKEDLTAIFDEITSLVMIRHSQILETVSLK